MFLNNNVVEEINKLKQQKGADLQVHGSSVLIQTLLKHDLVDELWLKIFPVVLGKGKRLFGAGIKPTAYTLIESKGLVLAVMMFVKTTKGVYNSKLVT